MKGGGNYATYTDVATVLYATYTDVATVLFPLIA